MRDMREMLHAQRMSTQNTTQWVPRDDTFGARLALIRHRMGWNQKEAALACGISQNSWRGWEQGRNPHDLVAVVERIAARTGVDDLWLLTGRQTKNDPGPGISQDPGRTLPRHASIVQPSDYRLAALAA